MKIAVTGHRPERIKGHEKEIYEWFKEKFAAIRPSEVITGMAQGVDQIAAQAAKDLGINYLCVYPYKRNVSVVEQDLIDSSSGVVWLADKYFKDCYTTRDRWMVDRSDKVLVVWDGKPGGGTYYTMNYANDKKKVEEILILR
jgi:uncharacterized phage-like protein YoqJ